MNLQTDNIKKSIAAAQLLIVRLKAMQKLEQDNPSYAAFKQAARLDLNTLNYSLQTVV